jgi:putative endopeptidase
MPSSPIDRAGFDTSVRPRDDFHAYVNGGWLSATTIPGDKRMVGMLDTMGTQAEEQMRDIVERHFGAEARESLNGLIDDLTAAFGRAIDGADWMGDETRAKAREKLAKVERRIGHPETWPDYSGLRISSTDLVGNVRRISAFAYDAGVDKLARPVERDERFSVPLWVTGTYVLTSNAIEFTAPLLQPPLFVAAVLPELRPGLEEQAARRDVAAVDPLWPRLTTGSARERAAQALPGVLRGLRRAAG